jgi:phenylacetate-CoA ligase
MAVNDSHTQKLVAIIEHAYARSETTRSIMQEAEIFPEDIRSLADLDKIPVTSKDRLIELQRQNPPFGGFLAAPRERLEHIFMSPGPIFEPHESDSALMDSVREILAIAGFERGDVALNAFSYHLIPTGLVVDQCLREIGVTVIPAGVGNIELQVELLRTLGVTAYLGTPSWLMALIQKAEEKGLDVQRGLSLKKALVSAEPLPPSMRESLVEGYGLKVTNAYGTAELGFLAYNNEGGLPMKLLESSIVQVVDPDSGSSVGPGEVGEVVVTTFNRTNPLIRLGTGDMAMNIDPAPGKSRQRERAIILVGRVGEAVKVRGMFVHPNQLGFAIGQVPGVSKAQAVVARIENRDELTLRVVPAAGADREALEESLSNAIQSTCRVKVDRFKFIQAGELDQDAGLILDQRRWQ